MGDVEKYSRGAPPAFYSSPKWSPDGKNILYSDNRLNVSYIDLAKKTPVRIDVDTYHDPIGSVDPCWSPDSLWIAFTKVLKNHLHAVFLYSVDSNKSNQISDGMSDVRYPAFDKNGEYLYFTASTNMGLGHRSVCKWATAQAADGLASAENGRALANFRPARNHTANR
jgi:tricorn protease